MQAEFGIGFPFLLANAEQVPCSDGVFDFAISEYGASLWCDPYLWIPEAARLLAPGGRLVFVRRSPLFALCTRPDAPASTSVFGGLFWTHHGGADSSHRRNTACDSRMVAVSGRRPGPGR